MYVLLNISYPVQVFSVYIVGGDEQASRLLQYLVRGLGVEGTVFSASVYIQTKTGSQADGADDWVVSRTIFVRHNPHARGIFVDQYMIRTLVWARVEEMGRVASGGGIKGYGK